MAVAQIATHLPDERLDTTGTTVDLVESDLTDDSVTVLPAIIVSHDELGTGRRRKRHTCGAS